LFFVLSLRALKKTAAIFFLAILVFNIWGYRWIFHYLEEKATVRLEEKLDAGDYNESQLVEIKIPLKLPYYTNWKEYEPHYGEAEWDGQHYQFVKRKLSNDTLFLLCISHTEKNNIRGAAVDYFQCMNDLQHDGMPQKSQQPSMIKLMMSEFLEHKNVLEIPESNTSQSTFTSEYFSFQSQFDPLVSGEPPEELIS
jgi:hypothetical protein